MTTSLMAVNIVISSLEMMRQLLALYKFDVDTRGFPHGCPGLHTFFPGSDLRFSDMTCGVDGRPRFVDPTLAWNDPNAERVTKNEWTDEGCPANCGRQDY